MSFTTEELNYLIWRYLQETGLEISAFALSDETRVNEFDKKYKDYFPIGSLVSLVQKGILYSQTDRLVKYNGEVQEDKFYKEKFSIFHALNADAAINEPIEPKGRFAIDDGTVDKEDVDMTSGEQSVADASNGRSAETDTKSKDSGDFIQVPERVFNFEPSTVADWNPTAPTVLAYGLSEARAKITVFVEGKPEETTHVTLNHPIGLASLSYDDGSSCSDITMISWSPMGHLLVTAVETGEIRLWTADGKLRNVLFIHHSPIIIIKWSPNSNYFLTTDSSNSSILWDANTGSVVQNLDLSEQKALPSSASSSSSQPATDVQILGVDSCWIDSTKFVLPGLNGAALVFNVGERNPFGTLVGHTKQLSVIEFNDEGQLLLTASDDKTIRIWNGQSFNNAQILVGHSQAITFATWINKNIVISTSLDSSVRLWDIRSGKQIAIKVLEGPPIILARFSPDRTKIVTATTENVITVFRIDINEKGDELNVIDEYNAFVPEMADDEENGLESISYMTSLKWSSDSKYVVASHSKYESIVLRIR